ncbi:putative transferase [Helianthus anomalus]
MMTLQKVKHISECFVRPQHDLSQDTKQPIYLTPFELPYLNLNYSQKGLLFAKPPPENQGFSVTVFLEHLRHSLSATLNHFYPLAARLATRKEENPPSYVIYIDPENSPGVKFVHATVDATVSDILAPDVPLVVHSFFDLNDAISHDGHTLPLLSIQVTELTDGIFIGGSVNHILADGTSFWHFMAAWSEIFRSKEKNGDCISRTPILKRWVLEGYSPITSLPFKHHNEFIHRIENPRVKERFFHFSSVAVSKLKAKANEECNMQKISSLQAVSALLWRCVTRVRCQPPNNETVCKFVINNRCRVNPPLSDDYFGNVVDMVKETTTVEDLMSHGLGWAALKMHQAVKNHDDAAVKKWVESWYKNPVVYKLNGLLHPNIVHIGSSPRFDMYGCEFGLGKAVAARSGVANKADGKMTMYPGREGGGSMDVEVCLLPEYMMALECDEEFISALKE